VSGARTKLLGSPPELGPGDPMDLLPSAMAAAVGELGPPEPPAEAVPRCEIPPMARREVDWRLETVMRCHTYVKRWWRAGSV
jgi:hypothetical protein